jgi:tetratricopeptide (TPR) repeat protein
VIFLTPIRRAVFSALALAALVTCAPQGVAAQAPAQAPNTLPGSRGATASGNFLAARHASSEHDAAAAAAYYRMALAVDRRNTDLLDHTFLALLENGDVEGAARLARQVLMVDKEDRIARLVLGVRAIKQKQYQAARQQLTQTGRGPLTTDLAATLLSAWTQATAAESKAGVDTIDKLSGPDWYNIFKDFHAGMMLDLAGDKKEAGKRLEHAFALDMTGLRIIEAYASYQSRAGNKDDALKLLKGFDELLPRHPLVTEGITEINAGRKLAILVDSPQAGAAEALYGLGSVIGRRGEELGLIYLQLALYLQPNHQLAILQLADLYEGIKKPELAVKTYERVPPGSPLRRSALIQRAIDLDGLDRSDEARVDLEKLVAADPSDLEAVMALGNVLRGRKLYAECADIYSKGLATVSRPDKSTSTIYYYRGICYERAKQWPKAEADFKQSLALLPDQPHVLNYLGYSWVDQGVNLDEGMRMIKRAVEQRADDGYIVDSLGWAFFRIGNFEDAVKELDRAVELKPEDPTINDHLGDAYWRVGRILEARFQWAHARDLNPEKEELATIEQKLKAGLPEDAANAASGRQKAPGGG